MMNRLSEEYNSRISNDKIEHTSILINFRNSNSGMIINLIFHYVIFHTRVQACE